MHKKYIVAILVTVFILVINQVFIQYFLHQKKSDARTINLAGKQRMISQKINLDFYKILIDKQDPIQLPLLVKEWKNTHYNLVNNLGENELSPITDPIALQLMSDLSKRISFVEDQLDNLSSGKAVDLKQINTNQSDFLIEMNQVVTHLEKASSDKLGFIIFIELLLMIISILVIIFEVQYVFKPIQNKLVESLEETKKSKESLEKSIAELERKNQDLEQFAYAASHDLQEPLRTITSFTQLLHRKHKDRLSKGDKEEMMFIVDAARRMKALITGLLKYTTIGKKRQIDSIDCNSLVHTIKRDLTTMLEEKNAKLRIGELPKLNAYETEMRQLFQNLITNALKFQKTEVQPNIHITAKDLEGKYQFSIQDNGIGIAEEFQDQIFSIFKRLNTIDKYEGTGIGLAQCKKIVELHNGRIWVDSKENQGSTFHFTIAYSLS